MRERKTALCVRLWCDCVWGCVLSLGGACVFLFACGKGRAQDGSGTHKVFVFFGIAPTGGCDRRTPMSQPAASVLAAVAGAAVTELGRR